MTLHAFVHNFNVKTLRNILYWFSTSPITTTTPKTQVFQLLYGKNSILNVQHSSKWHFISWIVACAAHWVCCVLCRCVHVCVHWIVLINALECCDTNAHTQKDKHLLFVWWSDTFCVRSRVYVLVWFPIILRYSRCRVNCTIESRLSCFSSALMRLNQVKLKHFLAPFSFSLSLLVHTARTPHRV